MLLTYTYTPSAAAAPRTSARIRRGPRRPALGLPLIIAIPFSFRAGGAFSFDEPGNPAVVRVRARRITGEIGHVAVAVTIANRSRRARADVLAGGQVENAAEGVRRVALDGD